MDISSIAKALFSNGLFGVLISDQDRHIRHVNQRAAEIAGYDSIDELMHQNMRMLYFSDDDYMVMQKFYDNEFKKEEQIQIDYKFKRKDSSEIWCSVSGTSIKGHNDHEVQGVIWFIEDITKRIESHEYLRQANRELQEAHNELESIFSNSMFGICMLKGGRFIYRVNQRFLEITGYESEHEVIGKSVQIFHISSEAFEEFGKNYYNNLMNHRMVSVDYLFKKKDGSKIWIALAGKAVDPSEPPNLDLGVVWTIKDITESKEQVTHLEMLSMTDSLTGLYNRRYFLEKIEKAFDSFLKNDMPLSLLTIDLDYFKHVNDQYGHDTGDRVLLEFSNKCVELVRDSDIICRMGGEEFSIILPNTSESLAVTIAERLRLNIEETPLMGIDITISIGVATSNKEEDLFGLIKRADRRLYDAKGNGRNQVAY